MNCELTPFRINWRYQKSSNTFPHYYHITAWIMTRNVPCCSHGITGRLNKTTDVQHQVNFCVTDGSAWHHNLNANQSMTLFERSLVSKKNRITLDSLQIGLILPHPSTRARKVWSSRSSAQRPLATGNVRGFVKRVDVTYYTLVGRAFVVSKGVLYDSSNGNVLLWTWLKYAKCFRM